MIQAVFVKKRGTLSGFTIRGHAGFADFGNDIVCASVSSAVQLSANLITEGFKAPAKVTVLEDEISLRLPDTQENFSACAVLDSLLQHIGFLAEDFPGTIQITFSEK